MALALSLCVGLIPTQLAQAEDGGGTPATPIYMDSSYSYAERAADLVGRMTATQKGSQMYSENAPAIGAAALGVGATGVPATTGINGYNWWQEALHGYARGNVTNSNSYPQSTSVGNTWNPELYYREASLIGDEVRERANKITTAGAPNLGNAVNLTMYSPTVNLHRDPRWGRNEESYSEDPFLMSKMGSAFVQGIQGADRNGVPLVNGMKKVNATIKHYVANNSERNRLDGGAKTSMRALREYYAVPYRDIIQDANASSVMGAYSTLNGDPSSWSSYLNDTLLRQTYGLNGYTTGDCDSVSTIKRHNFTNPYTGKVLTTIEQLSQAMAHAMDLECSGGYTSGTGTYNTNMANMLAQGVTTDKGTFTENQVDISLQRLMQARMETGEWDANNAYTSQAAQRVAAQSGSIGWQTPERLKMIDDVNAEAVVMLKNAAPSGSSTSILPLAVPSTGDYKVAIVGAWQTNGYLGLYSASQSDSTNRINIQQRIASNITEKNPGATFSYLTTYGNSTSASSYTLSDADKATISAADAVIVVTGTNESYSKEDGDRTSTALPNGQDTLISNVGKLNPKTVAVMETAGPMQVTKFADDVSAILWSSFLGNRKVGFGDVITGKVNPSGKITDTWYQTVSDTGASDIPSILDYDLYPSEGKQGRTYMYYTGPSSYPFGYGLSFSTFEYSNLKIAKGASATSDFTADDTVTVSFDVKNTGSVRGKETAQLYVAQPDAPAELKRPIKRLEGFDKVELAPGETKTVTLDVKVADLAFYDEATDRNVVDKGGYQVQVGGNSASVPLSGNFSVSGAMTAVPAVVTAKPSQTGDAELGIEERLIFDRGETVDPKLTVSLSDESLWGYIIKQQSSKIMKKASTPFPDGMTFSYSSNRPSVASVTNGVITTNAPGVATITATATYNGKSASGEFVVYVVSTPYIDGIKVDGNSVANFKPDRLNYSIEVPAGTTTIPNVSVVNANSDVTTVVTPPSSLPGVTTIVATNNVSGATATYRVGIGYRPTTVDLTQGETGATSAGWTMKNPSTQAAYGPGGLTITTERGAFGTATPPQNVLLNAAAGDWVAQTQVKLAATPTASNQQAGVVVYDTDTNYTRFVYERPTSGSTNVVRVYSVVNGVQTQTASANLASQTSVYFQVVKQGDSYTYKYSTNGSTWSSLATSVSAYYALPQLGLYATSGDTAAAAISATYAKVSIFTLSELYPRLSSLSVNGSPVAGFDPEVFSYNQEVSADATEVPVIAATVTDPAFSVTYNQMTTPRGTAAVTVSTGATSVTYTVSFNSGPRSDYFADGTKSSNWTVLRENQATYSTEKGLGLRLPTQRYDIYGAAGPAWENVVTQPAMGNWEVVAKLFYPQKPTANYQQAMLLVWQDEDNYIRLNSQTSSLQIQPGWENNGSFSGLGSANPVASADGSVTLYLRIIKNNTTYTLGYSQDGENYTQIGNPVSGVNFRDPKIGLFATQNSTATQMNTYFEYLTVTDLNGVQQKSYQQMLQDAVDNVRDYVAADIPAEIHSDADLDIPVPHGYTMSLKSSNQQVISDDGVVNTGLRSDATANLTVTITDGTRNAVSESIPVTVKASADPSVLQALVAVADGLAGKLGGYTTASVSAFTDALAAAKTVLADQNQTPDKLKTAADALRTAMSGLEVKAPVIDKSILKHVYDEARELSNSSGRYTSTTWDALQTEISQASTVLENASATQAEVDQAAKELATALSGLEVAPAVPDKSVLRNVHDAAAAVSNAGDVYTATSWSALQSSLASAETVLDKAAATQVEIDQATSAVTTALSGLVLKPVPVNTGVLRNATSVAGTMSNADDRYTAASWATLQQALTNARQVADDSSATQDDVDEAVSSLNAAIAGLVLNPPKEVEVPVVVPPTVTKLTLNQVQARVVKGKTLDLDEAVDYADGLPSAYSGKVIWTSSNTKVATVSSRGEVTGKGSGSATITATTIDKTAAGKTLSVKITVNVVGSKPKSKVTSITASVPKTMTVGQVAFAGARYASSKATGVKVTYSSSRYAVVDVDRVGRLTAVGKGTVTITIKAGGKTKTWKVTVK
ncbi:glycoside hydrolase family 3 C-terminal domain-containing protein [Propionicimonas paludicola]|nr:glycoside hydrolase family 3 C-terminal domain-containing protein [Propionicimonas paludicola]